MPAKTFEVEVRGLDVLRQKLNSRRLLRPTSDFIERTAVAAQRTAQRAAKPHPADKGTLGRAIRVDIGPDEARVYPDRSISGVAFTINEGRRPGKRPPYKAIKRWAIAHGIVPQTKNSKQVQQLREDIRNRGTKGVHFMDQAAEVADKALRNGVPETEREIKAMWER